LTSEGREGAFREDPWGVKVGASERQERVGVGKDCEGTTSALRTCENQAVVGTGLISSSLTRPSLSAHLPAHELVMVEVCFGRVRAPAPAVDLDASGGVAPGWQIEDGADDEVS
jgi:hypothetical protein